MKRFLQAAAIGAAVTVTAAAGMAQESAITVDPAVAAYVKADGVAGTLSSVGSDTLNNMMTLWVESFKKLNPSVTIQVEGKGSGTAPPALIQGTAQLGPMSREMKKEEAEKFEKKYGYPPTKIAVALDSLAVFVNKDNPIAEISFHELDAVFSKNQKGGWAEDIKTWGQLGLTGAWANRPISLYGRNSASGTYGYFKEHVLFKGDYKDTVKEQPGSAAVVNSISTDKAGIGYSGIGYRTSDVKAIAVSAKKGDKAYAPTYENVLSGDYPIARKLYVYVAKAPGKPLSPVVKEFLKFVLSKEGQEIVVKDGFMPLPAKDVEQTIKLLE